MTKRPRKAWNGGSREEALRLATVRVEAAIAAGGIRCVLCAGDGGLAAGHTCVGCGGAGYHVGTVAPFDWNRVSWSGPKQRAPTHCAYCEAKLADDAIPATIWNAEGWCAAFCDPCGTIVLAEAMKQRRS